jgi:SAM-dependent methyltransferase
MARRAADMPPTPRRASLLARLLGRWRRDLETQPAAPAAAVTQQKAEPVAAPPPLDPVTIRQWLWGPGYTVPGNAEHVLGLVKPFGLNPAMSMLDAAAGLGGPARTIADAFGTYVTGYERDPALARLGMEMSVAAGMVRRAPVSVMDPDAFELRPGAFDCILAREATCALADKERFLRTLVLGLKRRGAILLTDFVRAEAAGGMREFTTWADLQTWRPSPWTVEQYVGCLTGLDLDIRVTEDMSATYQREILTGWAGLVQNVDLRGMPRAHLVAVVDEAERWMRTIAALDGGQLRVYRFYALAGGRPGPR